MSRNPNRSTLWLAVALALLAITPGVRGQDRLSQQPQEPVTPLPQWRPAKPNVVYILCDDLGYGDVHAFNPTRGKIPTPNMDRLATQGMSFTDAHASASVCTPSRYSIMTGRYSWRSRLQAGAMGGDAQPLLAPGRMTVASMLRDQGYDTVCFGKWHLGLKWGPEHYRGPLVDGPLQHGFDHFFGISASLDMAPYAFIDDDRFTEAPTTQTARFGRKGPAAPSFEAVNVVPALVTHATDYLGRRTAAGKPFFLYLPLSSPHTPLVPTPEFQGKSGLGTYGDFVMETDWAIGQVLKALDDAHLSDNTVVFLASDNGFAPYVGAKKLEDQGHFPSGPFRGYKSDIWDGGHHEPFIVRWPGTVAAGSKADQTVCLGDLIATLAQVTGVTLPANAGEDSFSLLPILLGEQKGPLRYAEVHHSNEGYFAIRQGQWKLALCAGSGGWSQPVERKAHANGLPDVQLYDVSTDIAEQHNVQADHPDVVARLKALLETAVAEGRTTPGPVQQNDAKIDLWKIPKPAANDGSDD